MKHWLPRVWAMVILAVSIGASSLYAQEDPVPNDSSWNHNFGPIDVNGPVHKVAIASNGDIYIGGAFTQVNGIAANRIARWNGTTWSALGSGIGNGSVRTIALSGADVYVGGNFTLAGDVVASSIARWNGSQWSYLGKRDNEQGLDSSVNQIVFVGNTMYVAGSFIYGGNNDLLNRIAKWNPTERIFTALEGTTARGLDDTVYAMVAQGTMLYAGGRFANAGGATAARVTQYNTETGEWSKLGSGVGQQGSSEAYVTTLAIKDSFLYAGGSFGFAGGIPSRRVAQWNLSTQKWSGVYGSTGGNGVDSLPTAMVIDAAGDLYVAGMFSTVGNNIPASYVTKWERESRTWSPLASGLNGIALTLASKDKYVYVGGNFTEAGGKPSRNFARWIDSAIVQKNDTTTDTNTVGVVRSVEYGSATLAAMPNPMNGQTTISFTLSNAGPCLVDISNVHGETVATLVSERLESGAYTVRWNASGVSDGIYFCNLRSGNVARTTKLVLVR